MRRFTPARVTVQIADRPLARHHDADADRVRFAGLASASTTRSASRAAQAMIRPIPMLNVRIHVVATDAAALLNELGRSAARSTRSDRSPPRSPPGGSAADSP